MDIEAAGLLTPTTFRDAIEKMNEIMARHALEAVQAMQRMGDRK
jgi:hypothetical protein